MLLSISSIDIVGAFNQPKDNPLTSWQTDRQKDRRMKLVTFFVFSLFLVAQGYNNKNSNGNWLQCTRTKAQKETKRKEKKEWKQ